MSIPKIDAAWTPPVEVSERGGLVVRAELPGLAKKDVKVPLPEGIDPTSATATLNPGILAVTMPAPPKRARGPEHPDREGLSALRCH